MHIWTGIYILAENFWQQTGKNFEGETREKEKIEEKGKKEEKKREKGRRKGNRSKKEENYPFSVSLFIIGQKKSSKYR